MPRNTDKFVPADNYKGLLRQAHALNLRNHSQQQELTFLRDKVASLDESVLANLHASLESEREMNAQLTNELEALTKAHNKLKLQLVMDID